MKPRSGYKGICVQQGQRPINRLTSTTMHTDKVRAKLKHLRTLMYNATHLDWETVVHLNAAVMIEIVGSLGLTFDIMQGECCRSI